MKENIENTLKNYLEIYKDEKSVVDKTKTFINQYDNIADWNNVHGHITAGAFVYNTKSHELLVLYHKDLKEYLYPGGHADSSDSSPLDTALRELEEETHLDNLKLYSDTPIDIDIHEIGPSRFIDSHLHFDFRYLFLTDSRQLVQIDSEESRDYKWVNIDSFDESCEFYDAIIKIKNLNLNANSN